VSGPEPYYQDGAVTLHLGDCLNVLPGLPADSIDAIVTDPPYGLEFMGAEWDGANGFRRSLNAADAGRDSVFGRTSRTSPEYSTGKPSGARIRTRVDGRTNPAEGKSVTATPEAYIAGQPFQAWCQAWATECLRVLKPGGWLLAFGGTRTWHRLTCGIEDAGFDIRDGIADLLGQDAPGLMWVYGSGFAKSKDAARAVDMHVCTLPGRHCMRRLPDDPKPDDHVCPESEEGESWRGWGTAAKPAWEPIVCARKPFAGSLGGNLVEYGTGALNVDGCRLGAGQDYRDKCASVVGLASNRNGDAYGEWTGEREDSASDAGRWPPNVLLTHSADCESGGTRKVRGDNRTGGTGRRPGGFANIGAERGDGEPNGRLYGDAEIEAWDCAADCPAAELDRQSGVTRSASGGSTQREMTSRGYQGGGLGQRRSVNHELVDGITKPGYPGEGGASRFFPAFKYSAKAPASERPRLPDGTAWPTVKPLPLVSYLVRFVTPPGGAVLDLFAGTGTTGEACIIEGYPCVLIEKDPVAAELIKVRLAKPIQPLMFSADPDPGERARALGVPKPPPVMDGQDSLFDLGEAS